MKKRISTITILGVMALIVTARARASSIGTIPEEPAATLLLPYFEVDLGNTSGATTRFSINNSSATAVLVHMTVWSDLSVPVLAFNVYLTGYDVQTIDMRDITNGKLPNDASVGQDPGNTISPKGYDSQDINFASCSGQLPFTQLPQNYIDHIRNSLTGKFTSFYGGCAGTVSGNLARGYVTLDTVNNCTLRFPKDPGYIGGDLTNQNVLWGDFSYPNSGFNLQGMPLVAVYASATDARTSTSGNYTFYGRYDDWTAADNRVPLATEFTARYTSGTTMAIGWRDPKIKQAKFTCGTKPSWYPLGQEKVAIFDEQEHIQLPQTFPVAPQPPEAVFHPFPAATQKILVGSGSLPVPFSSGFFYYNLNSTVTPAGAVPPIDPNSAQAWVLHVSNVNGGTFGNVGMLGSSAFQIDSALTPNHYTPPGF